MIKSVKEKSKKIEIDLTGPEGNVFVLIGTAKNLARQLGLNGTEITRQMMSSGYENAVRVFDENFGDSVTLYR